MTDEMNKTEPPTMAVPEVTANPIFFDGLNLSLIAASQFLWLHRQGVDAKLLASLAPLHVVTGRRGGHGTFEAGDGETHVVFEEQDDLILWQPKTNDLLSLNGRSFALNESHIGNMATYSFNSNLNIFDSVLDWMRADCDGIIILDWSHAFERLRDVPRIAVAENLLPNYRKWMKPARMPQVSVIPNPERIAA